jgi:hypothetical protein
VPSRRQNWHLVRDEEQLSRLRSASRTQVVRLGLGGVAYFENENTRSRLFHALNFPTANDHEGSVNSLQSLMVASQSAPRS